MWPLLASVFFILFFPPLIKLALPQSMKLYFPSYFLPLFLCGREVREKHGILLGAHQCEVTPHCLPNVLWPPTSMPIGDTYR